MGQRNRRKCREVKELASMRDIVVFLFFMVVLLYFHGFSFTF